MAQSLVHKSTPFILSVDGVSKSFDGFKAINDLSFYLEEGELRTIIGPNGAGKSTFMDLITARTRPDEGEITFHLENGHDVNLRRVREHQVSQLGIGRKFQNPTVYSSHSVYDNIQLSLNNNRGIWASLLFKEQKQDRDKIFEVMKTIRLQDQKDTLAGALSHGQKQWLEIGMLLAQDPKIMLVDEPAAGMSDEETDRTGELLLSLAGKHSLIVIEHDMEFVRQIASRVTVLHQGSVLKEGDFDAVRSDEKVIEVYLGRQARKH
ncbi:MAG: urea ABC transporter ATP-binding protein UrtD [Opitutaceae bacterium]|nr:urea ABC transporter ATP-binding protein UrtD [Opitutaceae bacterium]